MNCISMPYLGRCSCCWHKGAVGGRLIVSFLWSVSILSSSLALTYHAIPGHWWIISTPVKTHVVPVCTNGVLSHQSWALWLHTVADHEHIYWFVSKNNVWWRSNETPWCCQLAEEHRVNRIHQMKWKPLLLTHFWHIVLKIELLPTSFLRNLRTIYLSPLPYLFSYSQTLLLFFQYFILNL